MKDFGEVKRRNYIRKESVRKTEMEIMWNVITIETLIF